MTNRAMGFVGLGYIAILFYAIGKGFSLIGTATKVDPMATALGILGTLAIVIPVLALRPRTKCWPAFSAWEPKEGGSK